MQEVDGDVFLGVEDDDVEGALHLVAKALSESYGGSYDPPKNLGEGWIGIRVGVNDCCIKAVPRKNVRDEVLRFVEIQSTRRVNLDSDFHL